MRIAASIGRQGNFTDSHNLPRCCEFSGGRSETKTDVKHQITLGELTAITGFQSVGMGITAGGDQASHRSGTGSQSLGDVAKRSIDSDHHRLSRMGRVHSNNSQSSNSDTR